MAETHKGFGLLFEMGCGKTLTAIMIAGTAYQMGKVEKVLVVAPTSVCSVWPKDFAEFADFKANIKVLLGDKNRRLKLLNDLDNFPFKALKVAVINYESTWREGIFDLCHFFRQFSIVLGRQIVHRRVEGSWIYSFRDEVSESLLSQDIEEYQTFFHQLFF